MHFWSASKGVGEPQASMGTLLIVYFEVIVFLHWWGIFSSKVPSLLGGNHTTKMTWELSNTRDNKHPDEKIQRFICSE